MQESSGAQPGLSAEGVVEIPMATAAALDSNFCAVHRCERSFDAAACRFREPVA